MENFKKVEKRGNVLASQDTYNWAKTVFFEIYFRVRNGPALDLKKMEKDFDEILKIRRGTTTMPNKGNRDKTVFAEI